MATQFEDSVQEVLKVTKEQDTFLNVYRMPELERGLLKKAICEDRVKKVREILASIDHSKRSPTCPGYYVVYDSRLVVSNVPNSRYHAQGGTVPIDAAAPYGSAYYWTTGKAVTPLVKICDHSKCRPYGEATYIVVKQLNRDGSIGFEPTSDGGLYEDYYVTVRAHHRGGDDVVRKMKGIRGRYIKAENEKYRSDFLRDYLRAVKRMPYEFVPLRSDDMNVVELVRRHGWEHFLTNKLNRIWYSRIQDKNAAVADAIIERSYRIMEYGALSQFMMNPLLDAVVDILDMEDRVSGPASNVAFDEDKFLHFDIVGTWAENYEHDGILPAAFYMNQGTEVEVESPLPVLKNDQDNLALALTKRVAAIGNIRTGGTLVNLNIPKVKSDIFGLEENKGMVVRYDKKELVNGVVKYDICLKRAGAEKVEFSFSSMETVYMIDSIIDYFILHAKNLRDIEVEICFTERFYEYVLGRAYRPARLDSKLNSSPKVELLREPRWEYLYKDILRGLYKPRLTMYTSHEGGEVEFEKRNDWDNGKFDRLVLTPENVLEILKKLCRFHTMMFIDFECGKLPCDALSYTIERLRFAQSREYQYKEFGDEESQMKDWYDAFREKGNKVHFKRGKMVVCENCKCKPGFEDNYNEPDCDCSLRCKESHKEIKRQKLTDSS